jgi:hypothetical protein
VSSVTTASRSDVKTTGGVMWAVAMVVVKRSETVATPAPRMLHLILVPPF